MLDMGWRTMLDMGWRTIMVGLVFLLDLVVLAGLVWAEFADVSARRAATERDEMPTAADHPSSVRVPAPSRDAHVRRGR